MKTAGDYARWLATRYEECLTRYRETGEGHRPSLETFASSVIAQAQSDTIADMARRHAEAGDREKAMRLRDEFAMAAVTGFIAHGGIVARTGDDPFDWSFAAEQAYRVADAMLEARVLKEER